MAISNSISDFILFLSSLLWIFGGNRRIADRALQLRWHLFPALIGLTAITGSLRFAGFDTFTPISSFFFYAGTTMGVIGLVFAILQSYEGKKAQVAFLILIVASAALFVGLLAGLPGWYGMLLQGPAILTILILGLLQFRKNRTVAAFTLLALLFLASSALKGLVGQALASGGIDLDKTGLNDLQHYMMASAFVLFYLIVRKVSR
ncbi:MAG: hypothetical protein KDK37_05995 [Leptospiraceae bacterium]|nr:hypothetical protein [Leptospiraceae bacterium]